MLSIHGDFQLTQDSLVVWLADLEVVLTNLEHLSEAPLNNKLQQLDVRLRHAFSVGEEHFDCLQDIEREILEKLSKIEYVQTCANHLLSKTVDARGLTIDVNQLSKFCQQLTDLIKRIKTIKQKLINANDVRVQIDSLSA